MGRLENVNPQRQGNLEGPLSIVAVGDGFLLVVKKGEEDDPTADAQRYELEAEVMFDQIKPFALWLKFSFGVEVIEPPIPFTEEERVRRVEAHRIASSAREIASGEN